MASRRETRSPAEVERDPIAGEDHADWIIDLGPGAGREGGRVVFEGPPAQLVAARSTLTGQHLAEYLG